MNELLGIIALLCQVTGTYGSKSVAMRGGQYSSSDKEVVQMEFSYQEASAKQLQCQKYFIKCVKSKDLADCVLERK